MSKVEVKKDKRGRNIETLYRGTNKAILYKVKGIAKPMLSEDLYQHLLKVIGDESLSAKDIDDKVEIGIKKTSSALGRMRNDGLVQTTIIGGRMHYYKTDQCRLQSIFHPMPNFKILSRTVYTEKWFMKKLKPDYPKQKRRKKGEPAHDYKKYGD
jgi:DNA-binding transcriptional regulator GbsR (MarR family)